MFVKIHKAVFSYFWYTRYLECVFEVVQHNPVDKFVHLDTKSVYNQRHYPEIMNNIDTKQGPVILRQDYLIFMTTNHEMTSLLVKDVDIDGTIKQPTR